MMAMVKLRSVARKKMKQKGMMRITLPPPSITRAHEDLTAAAEKVMSACETHAHAVCRSVGLLLLFCRLRPQPKAPRPASHRVQARRLADRLEHEQRAHGVRGYSSKVGKPAREKSAEQAFISDGAPQYAERAAGGRELSGW